MPTIRRIACLAVVLVLLAGCGSGSAQSGSSVQDGEECAQERDRLVEDVRFTLQLAANQMKADPDVLYIPRAFGRVGGVLDTVAASNCVEESDELDALVEATDAQRVTERDIRKAQAAFGQWARSMGSPDAKINYAAPRPDPCAQMRQDVSAWYRVIREPDVGGVRISMELRLENQGAKEILLDHGGQVRATHVRPNDMTRTYYWGGSSADTASAFPGRTSTQPIELVAPDPLRLFAGGRIEVFDVYGSAYSNVGPCPLKVSRAP